jgi:hypothetical protein
MSEGTLTLLVSDDLLAIAGTISGAPALSHFFASRNEVRQVASAIQSGDVPEDAVRLFTESLHKELKRGILFRHDLTLAALAVALEGSFTPFAEQYLRDLAKLNAAEMPYGPRVAREVLDHRSLAPARQSAIVASASP